MLQGIMGIIDSLSIPDAYRPAVITASATLLGAFFGAIVAQYFSHRMTIRREGQKYYKEIYQKLYAPILFDVYAYIDIYTHFRRGHDINHDVNEDEIYKKILRHIESNLMYATPKIISNFHAVKQYDYQDDLSGFNYRITELELLEQFLLELRNIARKSNSLDDKGLGQIDRNLIYLRVWAIFTDFFGDSNSAANALSYKFYYSRRKLTHRTYRKIKAYFKRSTLKYSIYKLCLASKDSRNKLIRNLGNYVIKNFFGKYSIVEHQSENVEHLYKMLITKRADREELVKDMRDPSRYSYSPTTDLTHIVDNVLFLSMKYQIIDKTVIYNIELVNHGMRAADITINQFILVGYNVSRLVLDQTNSFFLAHNQKFTEYRLYPNEKVELTLTFNGYDEKNIEYTLYFDDSKKCYPIYKHF